jgi:hypothetical protein
LRFAADAARRSRDAKRARGVGHSPLSPKRERAERRVPDAPLGLDASRSRQGIVRQDFRRTGSTGVPHAVDFSACSATPPGARPALAHHPWSRTWTGAIATWAVRRRSVRPPCAARDPSWSEERRRRHASGVLALRLCPDPASDIPLAPRDAASPASTASRPADRDDREPPLVVGRDGEDYSRSRKIVNSTLISRRKWLPSVHSRQRPSQSK